MTDIRSYRHIEAALLNTPRTPEFEVQVRDLIRVAEAAEAWNEERKRINDRSRRNEPIGGSPMRFDALLLTEELDAALAALKGN